MLFSFGVKKDSPATVCCRTFELSFNKHVHQVFVQWFVPTILFALGALFLCAFRADDDFTVFALLGMPHYI